MGVPPRRLQKPNNQTVRLSLVSNYTTFLGDRQAWLVDLLSPSCERCGILRRLLEHKRAVLRQPSCANGGQLI